MASKKVLGRGLGAFFPEYADDSVSSESNRREEQKEIVDSSERVNIVLQIPVDHIRPNPNQPRKDFNQEALDELAESIKTHGIIQPITVRYLGEKRFELISGERRLRAAKRGGIREIAAYIREADDEQSMAFALIENIQREELNPLEIAMGYKRLLEEFNYTQAEVAQRVGKNRSTVTNTLRLLNLPDFIQVALKRNDISGGHARALITIEDEETQEKILDKIINYNWSVRQTEEAVRKQQSKPKKSSAGRKKAKNPFYDEISGRLRRTFSTKVDIKEKPNGGEIRIEFYGDEDLERILALLDTIE